MSDAVWFLGLRRIDVERARKIVNEALSLAKNIRQELLDIEHSILNGVLERDLNKLYELLIMLNEAGINEARSYSNRAQLLAEYARALRVRIVRLGPRGLSDARDEIMRNLGDIETFIRRVQALLQ